MTTSDYDFRMRLDAPRPVVFERLLRIEHLSRWFCGWCRIEPKVGGAFKFGGETCIVLPEGRAWETTIDEGEPLRRFAYTWPIRSTKTRVSYDLEDGPDDTTLLRVGHRGVPFADTTCGTIQDAWRMCLGNLKSIAEGRGDSVRPDHSPTAGSEVRLAALIETKPEAIFDAFADSAKLNQWSTATTGVGAGHVDPRRGGAFSFGWSEGPDEILDWDLNRRIRLRWPRAAGTILLGFDFEEKASGTAIYCSISGFHPDQTEDMVRLRGRWSDLLVCLKNFVESGTSGFLNPYADQVREAGD